MTSRRPAWLSIFPNVPFSSAMLIALGGLAVAPACKQMEPWRDPSISRASIDSAWMRWRNAISALDPGGATARGDHRFDSLLEPPVRSRVAFSVGLLKQAREELTSLASLNLAPEVEADRLLLLHRVNADLVLLDAAKAPARDLLWSVRNVARALASLEMSPDLNDADRVAALTARLGAVRSYFAGVRETAQSPSQLHCEQALEAIESLLSYVASDVPSRFAAVASGDAFVQAATDARAAIEEHRAWLAERVTTGPDGHHRLGRDRFEALVRAETGLDSITASQIADFGEAELEGARARLLVLAAQCIPAVDSPEEAARQAFMTLDSTGAVDRETFAPMPASAIERARNAAVAVLGSEPSVSVEARDASAAPRLGSALAVGVTAVGASGVRAVFVPTLPFDRLGTGGRRAWYSTLAPARLEVRALADLVPGRASLVAARARSSSAVRRDVALAGFELGWGDMVRRAVAANQPAIDTADAAARLTALAHASEDVLVALRAIAAPRIHAATMSVAEATELFRRRGFLDAGTAQREAVRCATDPLVALELVGRRELEDIIAELKTTKSLSAPVVRSLILQKGSLPLSVLRRSMLGAGNPSVVKQ